EPENECRRLRGRRYSCTPWPARSERKRHRVSSRRTLRASGGVFSFGRSLGRPVLYRGGGTTRNGGLQSTVEKLREAGTWAHRAAAGADEERREEDNAETQRRRVKRRGGDKDDAEKQRDAGRGDQA